ncbi:MAG: hypothetical protein ACXVEF_18300 [Polyangiales bacterium]
MEATKLRPHHVPGRPDLFVLDTLANLDVAKAAASALTAAPLKSPACFEWPARIMSWFFSAKGRWPGNALAAKGLSKEQREVLSVLSERASTRNSNLRAFTDRGVPGDVVARRRLLGLEPPTLLERVITFGGKKAPVWQHFFAIKKKHDVAWERARKKGAPLPPVLPVFEEAIPTATTREWLDLFMDVSADLYDLYCYDPVHQTLVDRLSRDEVRSFVDAWIERMAARRDPYLPYSVWHWVAYAATRLDGPIPEALDPFVRLTFSEELAPAIFSRIPAPRRARILTLCFDEAIRLDAEGDSGWATTLVDRAPKLGKALFPTLPAEIKRFKDARTARMAAAREAVKPRAKKPAKKKPAPPAYTFTNERRLTLADFAGVPAAMKNQFLAATKRYDGKSHATPAAFFASEAKALDEPAEGIVVGLWDICVPGEKKPLYEMWTFLVDNGTVFRAGTAEHGGVHMIQGSFQPIVRSPQHEALAEELQKVVPF